MSLEQDGQQWPDAVDPWVLSGDNWQDVDERAQREDEDDGVAPGAGCAVVVDGEGGDLAEDWGDAVLDWLH